VSYGPFLVDSQQLGFWSAMLWVAPIVGLLVIVLGALGLRRDWRDAVLQRIGTLRGKRSTLPARV
jgi:type III secretion protein J